MNKYIKTLNEIAATYASDQWGLDDNVFTKVIEKEIPVLKDEYIQVFHKYYFNNAGERNSDELNKIINFWNSHPQYLKIFYELFPTPEKLEDYLVYIIKCLIECFKELGGIEPLIRHQLKTSSRLNPLPDQLKNYAYELYQDIKYGPWTVWKSQAPKWIITDIPRIISEQIKNDIKNENWIAIQEIFCEITAPLRLAMAFEYIYDPYDFYEI